MFWVHYSLVKPSCSNFRVITANFWGVRIFRIFTVHVICWILNQCRLLILLLHVLLTVIFECHCCYTSRTYYNMVPGGGGGISCMNLVQVCHWASLYPHYKCILEYGKSIPANVYTIMEDNKKCSLLPFKLSCLVQKIISTVKYWIINSFLSESNKIT